MARVKGTVRHLDLEGGLWVLEAEDGTRYQLRDAKRSLLKDGLKAVVKGEVVEDDFTLGMAGPTLLVSGHREA